MANSYQCPQCGAASSVKISDTEFHCTYCDSNFTVGMSKEEMIASILAKAGMNRPTSQSTKINQQKLDEMRAQMASSIAASKKKGCVISLAILIFILGVVGFAVYNINKSVKSISASIPELVQSFSINKFQGFAGSKGAVIWILFEDDKRANGDSTQYILKIIDPKNNKTLQSLNFIPELDDKQSFDADKQIGDFYSFGDTCWIVSEQDGLRARDIYSGKIIMDEEKLAALYPKLKSGIAKASYQNYSKSFELTTNDGFEFIFHPDTKQLFTKEDWDLARRGDSMKRTWFIFSDGKRPELFISVEKNSPLEYSPRTWTSELENFKQKKKNYFQDKNILSITEPFPTITFFNPTLATATNTDAIILYQNSIGKLSGTHISKVSADGKLMWDLTGPEIRNLSDQYGENKYGVDYSASKNELVLYYYAKDRQAMGIDMNTGRVLWTYSTAPTTK